MRREAALLEYRELEARKRGFCLTEAQFMGLPIPDERNAAKILASLKAPKASVLPSPTEKGFAEVKTAFEQAAPYFAKVEALAANPGIYRPEQYDFSASATVKTAVKTLCLRAELRASEGDAEGALADMKTAATIGDLPLQRPTLIDALVALATRSIFVARCERLASLWADDPSKLQRLEELAISRLQPIDYQRVIRMEAFIGNDALPAKYGKLAERGSASAGLACKLRFYDALSEAPTRPWLCSAKLATARPTSKLSAQLMQILAPVYQQATVAFQRNEAHQNCLLALVRCARYRAQHGALAPTLAAMGADLPDPFSSHPLRLRVSPEGFRVYSVGDDGKDDGGVTSQEAKKGARTDIALGIPAVRTQKRS